jgi:hypothetical protein
VFLRGPASRWTASAAVVVGAIVLLVVSTAAGAGMGAAVGVVAGAVGGMLLVGLLRGRGAGAGVPPVTPVPSAPRDAAAPVAAPPGPPEGAVLPPVRSMTNESLGWEWMRTAGALGVPLGPATREHVVRRRREVLDELERRDPDGVARWLADGGSTGSDPASYVRQDPAAG